ncbi:hypothetical protein GH714_038479 [Hevea brasiliensis]|uniref:Uncharacterized protein n=1 Tax=Hevea brasiliensis TaxID=3981 RepID=A0A6A6MN85_HEVBR|nr:hypothetical protein GH714_038479 [Hevea brasiliensis]
MNTWDRHGSGQRPDAPRNDLRRLRLSTPDLSHGSDNLRNNSGREAQVDVAHGSHSVPSQHDRESSCRSSEVSGRYLFARTRSSPELTETYGEVSCQGRRNRTQETGKGQSSYSSRKNLESDNLGSHGIRSSTDDPSSIRLTSSRQSLEAAGDSNSGSIVTMRIQA